VAHSWNRYLALNPAKPNPEIAQRMAAVFGEEGLNDPAAEVQVLQLVVAARPTSASLYASLAAYAYRAHNVRVGDLASAKAVALAPLAERPRLKNALAALKKSPTAGETETATSPSGQAYLVKRGANGSIKATPAATSTTSTPAPAGQSPSKKK
jgi:hypothetical protein